MRTAGSRLGPYEVHALIGAGGMGEVYRARDTRLGRTVALKVLPDSITGDPEQRSRFEREARILSSLNHPGICALFDVGSESGVDYLVMEHLEGQTLADCLSAGKIPVVSAMEWSVQMADALAAAHRAGITHRDLKPGNVMLGSTGVKLLDFGLARRVAENGLPASNSGAPTLLTTPGTILGTMHYMAPEQIEGREADVRSDIFALGAVLYEMLSGKRAFEGKTGAQVISAILRDDPQPLSSLRPEAGAALDRCVRKCLARNPESRWQSASDLRDELAWIASGVGVSVPAPNRSWRDRAGWIAAAGVLFGVVALWVSGVTRTPSPGQEGLMRMDIVPPAGASLTGFSIAPDGRAIVFQVGGGGRTALWLRRFDEESAGPLPGTADGLSPFWSPDSRSLAFFADQQLKRLDIASGVVQPIVAAPNGRGGSWGSDGTILFTPSAVDVIYRVQEDGSGLSKVTELRSPEEFAHRFPHFLPDGRHFLFHVSGKFETRGIYIGALDSKEKRKLLETDAEAVFSPPDMVLFSRRGALLAQRLDMQTLTAVGAPLPVARHVAENLAIFGDIALSASASGSIGYRASVGTRQLVWVDRSGKPDGVLGEPDPGVPANLSFSHNGRMLALDRSVDGNSDIFVVNAVTADMRRFTVAPTRETTPIWSPDDTRLLYESNPNGSPDIYDVPLDGSSAARLVVSSPLVKEAEDYTPDGRILYSELASSTLRDIWLAPLSGGNPSVFVQTPFVESLPRVSPDGRWVVYQSNEGGRFEIYMNPYPGPGARVQISTKGGRFASWTRKGELVYLSPENRLMAVSIGATVGSVVDVGTPEALFSLAQDSLEYAAAPGGNRFLINTTVEPDSPITILLHWKPGANKPE